MRKKHIKFLTIKPLTAFQQALDIIFKMNNLNLSKRIYFLKKLEINSPHEPQRFPPCRYFDIRAAHRHPGRTPNFHDSPPQDKHKHRE